MEGQRRLSECHVPGAQANLTDVFAASKAAGVKFEYKHAIDFEFDHNASRTNWYGIFQDEIPWLESAMRIYSDIKALCSYRCTDNCGICRIR